MLLARTRLAPPWLRTPRLTARLRLTALYSGLFLACGAILLAITYVLARQALFKEPHDARNPATARIIPIPDPAGIRLPDPGALAAQQQRVSDLNELLISSGIALGIVAVIAIALGWLAAGRVLRPLAAITATARRISASSLDQRLSLQGPDDELKDLGDTLDDLFTRLEASFAGQRHFIANASHELQSPVTRQRALLEVALADPATTTDTWQAVSREVLASNVEQESLIDALLTLATSESGLDQREPVDLATVTAKVLLIPRPRIDSLGLRVESVTRPAVLDGDPLLVERLIANLIDNAVTHNVPGGSIQVATRTSGIRAVLSVASTGPVIPPADVDRLFQPFQRLHPRRARRRAGHGLGLSIVEAITTAHGGTITAQANPGGGLTVKVTFPAPASPWTAAPGNRSQNGHRGAETATEEGRQLESIQMHSPRRD